MIHFTVPLKTVSLNKWYAGTHWTQRKKLAKEWHETIYWTVKELGISKVKHYPLTIRIKCYFKSKRLIDLSNTCTALKLVEDSLVKAGIIIDDSPKYITRAIIEKPEFGCEDKVKIWLDKTE